MKKILLLMLVVLLSAFNATADEEATELNCNVEINYKNITDGSAYNVLCRRYRLRNGVR